MDEQEEPKKLQFHTVRDVLQNSEPEPDWVIEGVAAKGALTTMGGYIGAGKSPWMVGAANKIADIHFDTDHTFCGLKVNPLFKGRVVYLTEEPRRSFERALAGANIPDRDLPFDIVFWDEAFGIPWEDTVEQAWRQAEGGVLFVDTAFRWASPALAGGNAENDSATMQGVYGPLIKACVGNTTVIVSAHTRKDFDRVPDEDASIDWIRGSGAVVASSSVVLLYKKASPNLGENVRFLRVGRSRLSTPVPEDRYVTLTPEGFSTMGVFEREARKIEALDEKVLSLIRRLEPVKNADLKEAWEGRVELLTSTVKRLYDAKHLTREGAGKKGDPYIWSSTAIPFPPFPGGPGAESRENPPEGIQNPEGILDSGNGNRKLETIPESE